jgi:exopolysaccharide biosynthesis protein
MSEYNGMPSKGRARRKAARRGTAARKTLIVVVRFLLLNMLIFILAFPLVVWLGAFPNVKTAAIESIGASGHQYLLRYLGMSQQEIEKAFNNQAGPGGDTTRVTVTNHDNTITEQQVSSSRFKGYLLEITDPTRWRLGVTDKLGVEGETTSQIAQANGAIAAVNAGGFADPGGTGTGRNPDGVIIHNGVVVWGGDTAGKVNLIGLKDNGILVSGSYTLDQIRQMGIRDGISFGPTLIKNGEKQITHGDGGKGIAPRTAIGQKQDGTILLLVIDGRQTGGLIGATLLDVQNILYGQGAWTAANLDGGSSTTMYYGGQVINSPCDPMGERMVPTAFIVK